MNNMMDQNDLWLNVRWICSCAPDLSNKNAINHTTWYGTNKKIYDIDYLCEYYERTLTINPCNIFYHIVKCISATHIFASLFTDQGVQDPVTDAKKHQILLICIGRHWWV